MNFSPLTFRPVTLRPNNFRPGGAVIEIIINESLSTSEALTQEDVLAIADSLTLSEIITVGGDFIIDVSDTLNLNESLIITRIGDIPNANCVNPYWPIQGDVEVI